VSRFKAPAPDLQISFYYRLKDLRQTHLLEALLSVVGNLEIPRIDQELREYAPSAGLQAAARWGLRGEIIFPVPYVLQESPALLGYYRLLLGLSQKQFYGDRWGFAPFKSMEETGCLSERSAARLPPLCRALCQCAQQLVEGVDQLSSTWVHDLTLLTLGAQLRGGALNRLGTQATRRVFDLLRRLLSNAISSVSDRSIELQNAAGRVVRIEFANDPDICVREELPSGKHRNLVAIEIKGGRDYSNIHNRVGEAEKSHQKARKQGYVECWTIVGVAHLDLAQAKRESPTTDRFYRLDRITEEGSEEFEDFREHLRSRVGIGD